MIHPWWVGVVFVAVVATSVGVFGSTAPPVRRYVCDETTRRCVQQPVGATVGNGMGVCRLMCDPHGSLWPLPVNGSGVDLKNVSVVIDVDQIYFTSSQPDAVKPLVDAAVQFFLNDIKKIVPLKVVADPMIDGRLSITTVVKNDDTDLTLSTDESYTLEINQTTWPDGTSGASAVISGQTFFGVRHGLESLSQLLSYDEVSSQVVLRTGLISNDHPRFPYRGLVLDTSRQFIPVTDIRRLLDAMSYNKMNYLHWHLTDTSSFPFESLVVPEMTYYGALDPLKVYPQADVKVLVAYGLARGVRIIPELDAPAHAGNGWQWGPMKNMGDLAVCINQSPWIDFCVEPPCGQLNPVNQNLYSVLNQLYEELFSVFQGPSLFHMGGDEVFFNCWNTTASIVQWLVDNNRGRSEDDFLQLWGEFQQQAYQRLQASTNKKTTPILWTNNLVNGNYAQTYLPPQEYIVQVWDFSTTFVVPQLLQQGYRLLISNADTWYLDCGFGAWVEYGNNWCSPYKEWQLMYDNRPYQSSTWKITDPTELKNILGGEVALWTEEADGLSMDSRIWPRAAAVAERLWSDPTTNWLAADDRMQFHRARLVNRGIGADALQPLWCLQNQGLCTLTDIEQNNKNNKNIEKNILRNDNNLNNKHNKNKNKNKKLDGRRENTVLI